MVPEPVAATSPEEASAAPIMDDDGDHHNEISKTPPALLPPIPPFVPSCPSIPPPPVVPSSIPPPLASLPAVRAPASTIRPHISKNGEPIGGDSDSDNEGTDHRAPHNGAAAGSGAEYEISEESKLVRERQEKAMQDLLMKRRASALAVPTNDAAVRARLRRLGEPVTLFGEREMERRDRLRAIMAKLDAEGQLEKLMKAHEEEDVAVAAGVAPSAAARYDMEEDVLQYPFYTEGPKDLLRARVEMAKYSLVRAAQRLQRARRKRDDPDEDMDAELDCALKQAGSLVLDCSEIGDDRPISGCSFSPDGSMLATWYTFSLSLVSALC